MATDREALNQIREEIKFARLRLSSVVDYYVNRRAENPDWASRLPLEGTQRQILFTVAEWAVGSTGRYLNELLEEECKLTEDLATGDTVWTFAPRQPG